MPPYYGRLHNVFMMGLATVYLIGLEEAFDAIRKVDELGHEFGNAKDLAKLLGYRQYTNFTGAIRKAEIACKESGEAVPDHFLHVKEMIPGGKGATRPYSTDHLSRFACYLLVENADP